MYVFSMKESLLEKKDVVKKADNTSFLYFMKDELRLGIFCVENPKIAENIHSIKLWLYIFELDFDEGDVVDLFFVHID